MKLKIYDDRKVVLSNKIFGVNNENKVVTIELEYPKKYTNYTKTIEMKDGDWLVSDTIEKDEYILKSNVTSHEFVSAQIVFTDENDNIVFKSEIFEMKFEKALNAVEPLDDTDAKAEEILIGKKAYVQSEKITGTMPNNGELNYTPTTQTQIIPEGYTTGGIIGAVSSDIDSNIIPTNIRAGVSVLGIEGNLEPDKPDQSKTVNPTTQEQVIRADTGYELAQVTINPVTSAIDSNITQGNIKKDVTILEVTGTYEPNLQNKSVTITENGTSTVTADSGYDGLDEVEITTNVVSTKNAGMDINGWSSYGYAQDNMHVLNRLLIEVPNNINTSNWTTFGWMFRTCVIIPRIDVSGFNTDKINDMQSMFEGCNKVTEIIFGNNFSTSKVTKMNATFKYCNILPSLNINNWNVGNVINMNEMFRGCSKLADINLSNWNIPKLTMANNMFQNCSSLSNESLNSILKMISTVSALSAGNRTLGYLGLTSEQIATCTTLSNWADAQNAGWSA